MSPPTFASQPHHTGIEDRERARGSGTVADIHPTAPPNAGNMPLTSMALNYATFSRIYQAML